MATNTPNYNLKKPSQTDFYDVDDFNANADIIDEELAKKAGKPTGFTPGNIPVFDANGNLGDSGKDPTSVPSAAELANKVDKIAGKGLSTNDYTTAEKTKLAGLANYNDTEVRGLVSGNTAAINQHTGNSVVGEVGIHNMRYFEETLQIWNGEAWEDVASGTGKVPVGDCTNISLAVGNASLTIKWTDPDDIIVSGQIVATWGQTKLVRKVGGFPTSDTDGTLVMTNAIRNQYANNGYTDAGLTNGVTYYYKLFPISTTNAVNNNSTNNISGTPQPYKTYGVSIDLNNSNPLSAVTYTDDAVGMTAGSSTWDSQPIFKDIKPCVLKNGVVQYYLNPSNFAQKADGTAAVITGNDGDVMIEFPKIGFQINTAGNTLTIKITDDPAKSGFRYYAHTRVNEGDRNKLYIGAYKGSFDGSNKLRSISGVAPGVNQTIGVFRTRAQSNGSGYDQMSFYPLTLVQCLFAVKYKNLDCQSALGRGFVDGNSAAINTGGTNAKGMYFGETTGKLQMKCFGLEDLWGNVYNWIDGLFSDANRNIMTAFQNFNDTGANYTNRGQGATANIGGYMSKPQGTSETGFIAKEVSGSSTTYFADYAHLHAGSLPRFGGFWSNADYAGVFRLNVIYSTSSTNTNIGGQQM